jgi:hypothetical protein
MKGKDFFSKLKTQAKIEKNEDLDKFIEAFPDTEIPDVVVALIEENFLTRDRAMVDKTIYGKVKAETYNAVDVNIEKMLSKLPISGEETAKILEEKDTHRRLGLIESAVLSKVEALKKAAPADTAALEEAKKMAKEETERAQAIKVAAEAKEKQLTEAHQKELKKYRIETALHAKLSQIELAKEFTENPKAKTGIMNLILSEIQKNELDFDDKGEIVVQETVNGVAKPKYFPNSNDLVTVDKLLETETAPYLKRSNGGEKGKEKTTERKVVELGAEPTLAQLRAAKALA